MDATSSKNRHRSPGASSSGSGTSPNRRSARLSEREVTSNLLKQVTEKNFKRPQIKETPRTLLEGFASKQRDGPPVVRSDKTLELTASILESSKSLEKSSVRQDSFHEESFLHPSQKQTSLSSSARKRRMAPDNVPVRKSPMKTTSVVAVGRNWRRPKPIDHFSVKRQSRDTIEAALVAGNSPAVRASHQSPNLVTNQTDEEENELEFSAASIVSMTISRYEKDGVDKEIDEEADVESSSSKSAAQADMEIATPRAEKNMEDDADDNVGTAMGEQALRINRSYQRHAPDLSTGEMDKTLSTPQPSSRKSVTASSRSSSSVQHPTVSDSRLQSPAVTSSDQMPQLHAEVSTPARKLPSQAKQLSLSMPKLSVVLQPLPPQQSFTPASPLPTPVSPFPAPRSSTPASQLSVLPAVPEEFSVTSRNEVDVTSRTGVSVNSRQEGASTPTVEVALTPKMGTVTSGVESAGVEEASLWKGQVEEEESGEAEATGSKTPRLPWTPRLPPKAKRPMSIRKNRQSHEVEIQPETSGAAKPQPRAMAGASRGRGRPRSRPVQTTIPRSLMHSAFQFFAGMKVSKEALEEVDQISEVYWSNVFDDLEAYAEHGHRSIVERTDVELLMKRQRFVTENTCLNSLIEKYLAQEDREALIPIARAGNRLE